MGSNCAGCRWNWDDALNNEVRAIEPKTGGWIDRSFLVTCERGWYFFKGRSPAYTPDMVACDHALIQFLLTIDGSCIWRKNCVPG